MNQTFQLSSFFLSQTLLYIPQSQIYCLNLNCDNSQIIQNQKKISLSQRINLSNMNRSTSVLQQNYFTNSRKNSANINKIKTNHPTNSKTKPICINSKGNSSIKTMRKNKSGCGELIRMPKKSSVGSQCHSNKHSIHELTRQQLKILSAQISDQPSKKQSSLNHRHKGVNAQLIFKEMERNIKQLQDIYKSGYTLNKDYKTTSAYANESLSIAQNHSGNIPSKNSFNAKARSGNNNKMMKHKTKQVKQGREQKHINHIKQKKQDHKKCKVNQHKFQNGSKSTVNKTKKKEINQRIQPNYNTKLKEIISGPKSKDKNHNYLQKLLQNLEQAHMVNKNSKNSTMRSRTPVNKSNASFNKQTKKSYKNSHKNSSTKVYGSSGSKISYSVCSARSHEESSRKKVKNDEKFKEYRSIGTNPGDFLTNMPEIQVSAFDQNLPIMEVDDSKEQISSMLYSNTKDRSPRTGQRIRQANIHEQIGELMGDQSLDGCEIAKITDNLDNYELVSIQL